MDVNGARAVEIVSRLAAAPRFAGSEAEESARTYCEDRLRSAGFDVARHRFEFSGFPARFGPSIAAVVFAAIALGAGHLGARHAMPLAALLLALGGAAWLGVAARVLLRRGTLAIPWMRTSSVNLVATAANSPRPGTWLVAHTDSKSQTIPMLVRVVSVALSGLFFVVLCVLLVAASIIAIGSSDVRPELQAMLLNAAGHASVVAAIATMPVVMCFIGNTSRGGLDNATGLAAVLLAAEALKERQDFGVLLTSGEELGLAGARAFVAEWSARGIAINCDTVDDRGRFICMTTRNLGGRVRDAIVTASEIEGVSMKLRPMIPGILADNVAFTDGGWQSFTLSRGNIGTLARVHTSGDRAEPIDGTGAAQAARLLAAIVEEIA